MKRTSITFALLLASPLLAQSRRAPFHAATLVFPDDTSIVSTGDFDADGDVDAVGWYFVDSDEDEALIRVYHNDGQGHFTEVGSPMSLPYFDQFSWDLDVGTIDAVAGDDWVAGFDTTIQLSTGATWNEPGHIRAVALFDGDQDGDDDLVVLGSGLRYYQNVNGVFTLVNSMAASEHGELHPADADGAPGVDLLCIDELGVKPLTVQNGTLVAGATSPWLNGIFGGAMMVAGDIDGDGDDDVVGFIPESQFGGPATYQVLRRTGPTTFQPEPPVEGGPATGLADVDGDGDLDGVCCGGGGGPFPVTNRMQSTYHVAINDGTGAFENAWPIRGYGAFRLAGHADADGDGHPDLIAGRTILFDRGGFAYQPHTEGNGWQIPFADFDGDGDVDWDIRFAQRLENSGTGIVERTSVTPPPISHGWLHGRPLTGDFDGDGDVDMICRNAVGQSLQSASVYGMRLLLQEGAGHYVDGGLAAPAGVNFLGQPHWTHEDPRRELVVDFDGDGDLDVLTTFWPDLRVWSNDGSGSFSEQVIPDIWGEPRALVDIDLDGQLDLLTTRGYYFRTGPTSFALGTNFPLQSQSEVNVADLDDDFFPEILFRPFTSQSLSILWNQGNRNFQQIDYPAPVFLDDTLAPLICLDADDDGHQDVMLGRVSDVDDEGTLILFGDGHGAFPEHVVQMFDAGPLVDVDGDGDRDVLGPLVVRSQRYSIPFDGVSEQYGHGTPGAGGVVPKLGATGPFRAGFVADIRAVGAPGAAPVLIVLGLAPIDWAEFPLAGMTGFARPDVVIPTVATGAPGVPGVGDASFGVLVPAGIVALDVYHQAFVIDAAGVGGATQTAGLWVGYR